MTEHETRENFISLAEAYPTGWRSTITCNYCGMMIQGEAACRIGAKDNATSEAIEEGWTLKQFGQTADPMAPRDLLYIPLCPKCITQKIVSKSQNQT